MSFTEHRYRSHDGLELYYRRYGSGPDHLFCLPGLTRNCKDFEELATRLSADWTVITPDLRGRGESQWDPKPRGYTLKNYVRDVWKLWDELAVQEAVIIGTSLGGLIAMAMADQQAHRLRAVVLNDIGPEIPPAAITRILQYVGRVPPAKDWQAAATQARKSYEVAYPNMPDDFWPRHVRRNYRENAQGNPGPDLDPSIGDQLRTPDSVLKFLQWLNRHGLLKRLGGMAIDPWDSFRSMSMPCLLLHGELSDVLTTDITRRMQEHKPDLEVVTVPHRGHVPLLDEPECRAAIDSFLLRVLST